MMQKILKGDTSGTVSLALADGFDYSNATVEVRYQGAVRYFKNCTAGQTLTFTLTAEETAPMALGAYPVTVRIAKTDGSMITVTNAGVKIAVTDCVADVRAGSVIAVDAHGGLFGVDGLPAHYTVKDLRTKINEIVAKLGGTVAALCLFACTAFGAGVTANKATLEDLDASTDNVVTNVTFDASGLATSAEVGETATNVAGRVVSNVVTKAFVQGLGVAGNVESVNGQTGTVTITAAGIGAGLAVNGVFQNANLTYPRLGTAELLGETSIGESVIPSLLFFGSNGNLRLSNWGQLAIGTKSGATQNISGLITSLVGKPTNIWNGASTKYMNVDGEIYVYTNLVYYTSNINTTDPKHTMYPAGEGIWQTEDLSYWYTCRARWDGTTFHWAWYENGQWFEFDTSPGYVNLSSADIYPNGNGRSYHRNVREGWMKLKQVAYTSDLDGFVPNTRKVNGQPLTQDITIEGMTANAVVLTNGAAKTKGGTAITPAHVGAASASDLTTLAGTVDTVSAKADQANLYSSGVYQYMIGNTNAWFAETNYVTNAEITNRTHFAWEDGMNAGTVPGSLALWEIRDGQRQRVWDQRDWTAWYWSFKAAQLSNNMARVIGAVADEVGTNCMKRGWAKYTAVRGLDNPDPSALIVDTPKVQLLAGHQWEKLVETGGAGYWTLTGNGIELSAADTTNTFLTVKDFEGNACLTFRKTSSYLVYCECGTDITSNYMDGQGRVVFHITTDVQPTAEFSTTLDLEDFVEQGESGCPANYEWTGSAGNWDCHFLLKPGIVSDACFARFKVMREGQNVVEHTIPIKINGGIIFDHNGQSVKIRPTVTSTAVGSTVNWVVAQ